MTAGPVVYACIGNSDDKLGQARWSAMLRDFVQTVRSHADRVHGVWTSLPDDPWQNACAAFEISDGSAPHLKQSLTDLAAAFGQEAISWAQAPRTEFLGPGDASADAPGPAGDSPAWGGGAAVAYTAESVPLPTVTLGSSGHCTVVVNVHRDSTAERLISHLRSDHRRIAPVGMPASARAEHDKG